MKREIVKIDDEKCTGCGECIPNCHEGALQIIDGKAVLVSELMCDGLGACLGHCPEGALEIELREADVYDEIKVMEEILPKGKNVIIAHLKHLKEHGEFEYLKHGVGYLSKNQDKATFDVKEVIDCVHQFQPGGASFQKVTDKPLINSAHGGGSCPGAQSRSFDRVVVHAVSPADLPSALTQWPVQMHLINPAASFFQGADLLVAADCVAFSIGNFHSKYMPGKKLAIACPKLDSNKEIYLDKLIAMIDNAKVNTITVMIMEVPCCGGLLQLVLKAVHSAGRKVPVKVITVGTQGDILNEDWVN